MGTKASYMEQNDEELKARQAKKKSTDSRRISFSDRVVEHMVPARENKGEDDYEDEDDDDEDDDLVLTEENFSAYLEVETVMPRLLCV